MMDYNDQEVLKDLLKKACIHFEGNFTNKKFTDSLHKHILAYNLKNKPKIPLDGVSGSSIERALGVKAGKPSGATQVSLRLAFDSYIKAYLQETVVGFSEETKLALCVQSSCLCNKPGCPRLTCDKDPLDPLRYRLLGVAHPMKKEKYPQTLNVTQILELNNIENGIWLCAACDVDVKNHPEQFSETQLQQWKALHEAYLQGGQWPFPRPSSFSRPAAEVQLCGMIVAQIDNINLRDTTDVRALLLFLTEARKATHSRTPVYAIIRLMASACKYYLSATKGIQDKALITAHGDAFQKIIGLAMFHIVDIYRVRLTGKARKLLPVLKKD